MVKICGVSSLACASNILEGTSPKIDFMGMILWPGTADKPCKRYCANGNMDEVAKMVDLAKQNDVTPVGVFVDEDADTIMQVANQVGLEWVQLHGDGARAALRKLPMKLKVIYVMATDPQTGKLTTPKPGEEAVEDRKKSYDAGKNPMAAVDFISAGRRVVDYVLIDGPSPGSGESAVDAKSGGLAKLQVPRGCSRKGWILAGGLAPDNVQTAIETCPFMPNVVDVSSGVCTSDGITKDADKVSAFVSAATNAMVA